MRVDFYHLTAAPLEKVLPSIAERLLAAGERLLVVGEAGQLDALDRHLWTYAPEAFLPHGRAEAPRAAEQPVLLSAEAEPLNGARNIALVDGVWRDAALRFGRAFYFFDDAARPEARASWRALADVAEAERHYWRQDENGRWAEGP